MANSVTKTRAGQALLSVLTSAGALAVLGLVFGVTPMILQRSSGDAAAESANQMINVMLEQMATFPQLCSQLHGTTLPAVGSTETVPSIQFGGLTIGAGTHFSGLNVQSVSIERINTPALADKAVVKLGIRTLRPGSTDTYWSEVIIPVSTNGSTISDCIGATTTGSGTFTTPRDACEQMGGVWRDLFTNFIVTACDPASPDFAGGIGCPTDTVTGQPYPFYVGLPYGMADPVSGSEPQVNPNFGACDLVAGLCRSLGARISEIVPPNEASGVVSTGLVPVDPVSPYTSSPTIVFGDPSDPNFGAPKFGQDVRADYFWGFALACSPTDVNTAFYQPLVGDGGCENGLFVRGIANDGTFRCADAASGGGGVCSNTGRCRRLALTQGRCNKVPGDPNPKAAFHIFRNGVLDELACIDEPAAHNPTSPGGLDLWDYCVKDGLTVQEYRCPP